ncbi:MAG: SGNH/GDSL hydrolase family protein [Lentisphaeria bacterium]|nr:SGNH/GDSL hydrolase family protein [Lentisphaeria bacterium]
MHSRPRVLLLGDSIRSSYQPLVAKLMADRADVVGPDENGRFAAHTHSRLAGWLAELGRPDIVHWNNGLWDCGHWWEREPEQIPLDQYVATLRRILDDLRALTQSIIWATTTPIHEDRIAGQYGFDYTNKEIDTYNAAALAVMTAEGVAVNDLHAVISADVGENLGEDLLHLSERGQQRCAAAVVTAIERLMKG